MFPKRKFSVSELEYPFQDQWFEFRGAQIHYIDEGKGRPILMIHGNPTWSFLYRNIIKSLGPGIRSIAIDLPGFGFSETPQGYGWTPQEHAEAVLALIGKLDLKKYILVVQDWGGPIGFAAALHAPEKLAGIVNCGTWCWKSDPFTKLFSIIMGSNFGRNLYLHKNFMTNKFMPSGISQIDRKTPEFLKNYSDQFPTPESRLGTWIFARSLRKCSSWVASIGNQLSKFQDKPMKIIWPKKGWPGFWLSKWQKIFPQAAVEILPDARHYIQEDAPEQIAQAIRWLHAKIG